MHRPTTGPGGRTYGFGDLRQAAEAGIRALALIATDSPADVHLLPDPTDRDLVARLIPAHQRPATHTERDLVTAVPRRYSNRAPFWPDPVPPETRVQLIAAARTESAWLDLLVGMTALSAFSEITHSADRVLRRDTGYQAELIAWTHADGAPDGVPVSAGGPVGEPPTPNSRSASDTAPRATPPAAAT